jgi:hypothetical protein
LWFKANPRQTVLKTPSQKHPTQKRGGTVVQVIECKALSSNPRAAKKLKKKVQSQPGLHIKILSGTKQKHQGISENFL